MSEVSLVLILMCLLFNFLLTAAAIAFMRRPDEPKFVVQQMEGRRAK